MRWTGSLVLPKQRGQRQTDEETETDCHNDDDKAYRIRTHGDRDA